MAERTRQDVINDLRAPLALPPMGKNVPPKEQAAINSFVRRFDAISEALAIILAETRP